MEGVAPLVQKKANLAGIFGIVGLIAGVILIVIGSIVVARTKHLPNNDNHRGGFIGMIVVGCMVLLFGIVMMWVAAAADLTIGIVGSWSKPETCPKECKCC